MSRELDERKIWIDGCFDFTHHGHAGAMRQARQLGDELYVGIHSDEEILQNKGPVVMTLDERVMAVDGCKWSTHSVPGAPYVTDPKVMDDYGCKYVVHGDDITTDANGNDCYQVVKDMGRFVVVKRTPNISTTDLVGRMLTQNKSHHLESNQVFKTDPERFEAYATAEDGIQAGSAVYGWNEADKRLESLVQESDQVGLRLHNKIFYVDGAFDLFFAGHIEFLKQVRSRAQKENAAVIVGVQSDATVNADEGVNYPIMSAFERALCVLQCRYVDGIVLNSPRSISAEYKQQLEATAGGRLAKVFHGTGEFDSNRYSIVRDIFETLPIHKYSDMTTRTIVDRILANQELYEERQRKKGWKRENEAKLEANELEAGLHQGFVKSS